MKKHPRAVWLANLLRRERNAIYLGRGGGKLRFGDFEDHLLLIGPPRSGKTSGLLTPTTACHPGPVVAVSTRPDMLKDTLLARRTLADHFGGEIQQLGLAGLYLESGLPVVTWDLTDGCQKWEVARDRATTMVATAVPPAHGGDTIWRDSASAALAGCLHAAAVLGHSAHEMARRIRSADLDIYYKSIKRLYKTSKSPAAQSFNWLKDNRVIAENTRRSVFFVLSQQVLGAFDYRSPPAHALKVQKFVAQGAPTVYLTIPNERQQQAAPLVTSFIESVVAAWRQQRRQATRYDGATLLLMLDEAANISPLPSLSSLLTSGGGDGIQVVFALQEPSQANVWGVNAGAVLNGSRLVEILPGLRDAEYLELMASLSQRDVVYDPLITVSESWKGGERLATAERLIKERGQIENQTYGLPANRHHRVRMKVARQLAEARRRDRIWTAEEEGASAISVLEEVMFYTDVSTMVERRPSLEVSEISQAERGTVACFEGSSYEKLLVSHWSRDAFWSELLTGLPLGG